MAAPDFESWKIVSERIATFDKMLLDLRLKVLGYSAIAAGAVALLGEKTAALDRQGTALLFLFIALAVAAVAITDACYYYQLLCSAVGVAKTIEANASGSQVPRLHTAIANDVTTRHTLLYGLAFIWPTGFLVALAMLQSPIIGFTGCVFWVLLIVLIHRSLGKADSIIQVAVASAQVRKTPTTDGRIIGLAALWFFPLGLMVVPIVACLHGFGSR